MKPNEHISHLFTTCDEIFNKKRGFIPIMLRNSEGFVTFLDFPAIGWKVEVHPLEGCFETHLFDKGDDVPCWIEITGDTLQELEAQLELIHNEHFMTKRINTLATLTINATTPTSILRDLAARALGWVDRPYDSAEQGMLWHCEAQNAPHGPTLHKVQWKPDENSEQTLALIANLGINISVNHDEEEIKSRVLIEAAKIGARKLGENS